ncbi:MAG: TerS protein [Burkholderiales bacterium]|nr:TerS protein [Burkholderiales bacterium]
MRQTRSDSAEVAIQAAQNAAQGPLKPPAHVRLPAKARPFWAALVRNRPRHKWNETDLATAAMLARAQHDVERLQREIDQEGDVVAGKLNPKHALLDKLGRRIVTLSRLLHVHPEATQGRAREQGNALEAERAAEQALETAGASNVHHLIRRA